MNHDSSKALSSLAEGDELPPASVLVASSSSFHSNVSFRRPSSGVASDADLPSMRSNLLDGVDVAGERLGGEPAHDEVPSLDRLAFLFHFAAELFVESAPHELGCFAALGRRVVSHHFTFSVSAVVEAIGRPTTGQGRVPPRCRSVGGTAPRLNGLRDFSSALSDR
jgi:hypothetical protein